MPTEQPQPISDVERAILTSVLTEQSLKTQAFIRLLTGGHEVNRDDVVEMHLGYLTAIESLWNLQP